MVWPALRAACPITGMLNTMSAASSRRSRLRGVLVVHGHRRHQPVERQHARVVGDDQRGARFRQVLDAADLDAEPRVEKDSQQRQEHRIVEVLIEAEFVDGVIAHHSLANEFSNRGDPLGEFVWRLVGAAARPPRRSGARRSRAPRRRSARPRRGRRDRSAGRDVGARLRHGRRPAAARPADPYSSAAESLWLLIRPPRRYLLPTRFRVCVQRPQRCAADTARLSIERTHRGSMIGVNPRPRT